MKENPVFHGYDIIGDVHGCATAMEKLLQILGYENTAEGYAYPDRTRPRQAIFVGDLIDRGKEIPRTLAIAKKMCDNGSAMVLMGNHEFNAIAYHTPAGSDFLRPHNERNSKQIKATIDQFLDDTSGLQAYLEWFETLPLFLEFDAFRVAHACWDDGLIKKYLAQYGTNRLTRDFLMYLQDKGSFASFFIERLTRGISLPFPDGLPVKGGDGFYRSSFRVRFWSDSIEIYDDIVFQPDPLPQMHRERRISEVERERLLYYSPHEKPLFIGHYWLNGTPALVSSNIACLDYSAVNHGKLVAYRFDSGDFSLSNDKFVSVDCSAE